jgi:hypothetical protein
MVDRRPAIDRQPLRVRVAQLLVPVPVLVLVPVLEARWLALLLVLEAQRPVRPDLGSNPPQGPH